MDQVLTTGLIAIAAAAIPQLIQAIRAGSDRKADQVREHAQRAFEYKRAQLERHRAACAHMLELLDDYHAICKKLFDVEHETEDLRAERGRLWQDLDATGEMVMPTDIRDADDSLRSTLDALATELDALHARVIEHQKMLASSAYVLQLDYGTLDIMEPYKAFMKATSEDPTCDEANRERTRCIAYMLEYLTATERDLLRAPNQ